jgi:hypothetical protein
MYINLSTYLCIVNHLLWRNKEGSKSEGCQSMLRLVDIKCSHVCIYIHIYAEWAGLNIYVPTYMYMDIYIIICLHNIFICIYVYILIYVYIHKCMHIIMHIYIYVSIHICLYMSILVYVYTYIYTYIHTCTIVYL